jgi:diaminopimelate epimerase
MEFAGRKLRCSGVSVGNPHCVISGVAVTEAEARALGPVVENDPRFLGRTNVQLLRVLDRPTSKSRSGSEARATRSPPAALPLRGLRRAAPRPVRRQRDRTHAGGELAVEIDADYRVTQTGPATRVAEGQLARESWLAHAAWERG